MAKEKNKGGRPLSVKTPEMFKELFEQFKKDKKSKLRYTHQVSARHGVVKIPHEPPLTWVAFDVWLNKKGIIADVKQYRDNLDGSYDQFQPIVRACNAEIFEDKFDGAVVGEYQHNIIARELGLIDKQEISKQKIRVTKKKRPNED